MSRVLVIGWSTLNIARSLAAFSFDSSGVSFAAPASFFFAVLVSVTVGLTGAASALVSSTLLAGANHEEMLRQQAAKVSRAAESFCLFTKECLAAPLRGEKRNFCLPNLHVAARFPATTVVASGNTRRPNFRRRGAVDSRWAVRGFWCKGRRH